MLPDTEFRDDWTLTEGTFFLWSFSWGVKYLVLSGQTLSRLSKLNCSNWIKSYCLFFLEPSIKFRRSFWSVFWFLDSLGRFYIILAWWSIFFSNFADFYGFGVDLRGRSLELGLNDDLKFSYLLWRFDLNSFYLFWSESAYFWVLYMKVKSLAQQLE